MFLNLLVVMSPKSRAAIIVVCSTLCCAVATTPIGEATYQRSRPRETRDASSRTMTVLDFSDDNDGTPDINGSYTHASLEKVDVPENFTLCTRAPENMERWEQRSRTNDFSSDKVSDNLTEDFFKDYDILIKWSDDCNILDKLSNDCDIY